MFSVVQNIVLPFWKLLAYECETEILVSLVCLFFLLAPQPPSGVVFYSPLVGFSLLACEVS